MIKLYTCTDHDYQYPTGVASIVLAHSEEEARHLLNAKLVANRLSPLMPYTLVEVALQPQAIILQDGNY